VCFCQNGGPSPHSRSVAVGRATHAVSLIEREMPLESRNCAKISLISRRLREVAPTSHRTSHWDHTSNTHTERERTRYVQKLGYITRKQHRHDNTRQPHEEPPSASCAYSRCSHSPRERSSRVPLSPDSTRRRNTRRQAFVGGSPNRISQKRIKLPPGSMALPPSKALPSEPVC
jgi:hypothetical protein